MSTPDTGRPGAGGLTATWRQYLGLILAEGLEYSHGRVLCRPGPSPDQLAARVALFQLLTAVAGNDRTVRVATPWLLDRQLVRAPNLLLVPAAAQTWPLMTPPCWSSRSSRPDRRTSS